MPASQTVADRQIGGAAVEARIDLDAGALSGATVLELSFAGAPLRVVSRTMFTLGAATRETTGAAQPLKPT